MIMLLPLLCRLSARTRLAVGPRPHHSRLFRIIAALAHVVVAVIVGATFLSVRPGR